MVDTQNITLLIPKEVLAKIKVIAARRQASVSRMLTQTLEGLVQQEDAYDHARHRHAQRLKEGVDLGTRGEVSTGREELHERV